MRAVSRISVERLRWDECNAVKQNWLHSMKLYCVGVVYSRGLVDTALSARCTHHGDGVNRRRVVQNYNMNLSVWTMNTSKALLLGIHLEIQYRDFNSAVHGMENCNSFPRGRARGLHQTTLRRISNIWVAFASGDFKTITWRMPNQR